MKLAPLVVGNIVFSDGAPHINTSDRQASMPFAAKDLYGLAQAAYPLAVLSSAPALFGMGGCGSSFCAFPFPLER